MTECGPRAWGEARLAPEWQTERIEYLRSPRPVYLARVEDGIERLAA